MHANGSVVSRLFLFYSCSTVLVPLADLASSENRFWLFEKDHFFLSLPSFVPRSLPPSLDVLLPSFISPEELLCDRVVRYIGPMYLLSFAPFFLFAHYCRFERNRIWNVDFVGSRDMDDFFFKSEISAYFSMSIIISGLCIVL